jgi:hypothetical protein
MLGQLPGNKKFLVIFIFANAENTPTTLAMLIKTITHFLSLLLLLTLHSFAQKKFLKTDEGVIVYPDAELSGNTKAVKLQVVTENIIRVTASPFDKFSEKKSLITVYRTPTKAKWNVEESAEKISIKTNTLTTTVNLNTGAVSFVDNNGKSILKEKQMNGRSLDAAVSEGEPSYHIRQSSVLSVLCFVCMASILTAKFSTLHPRIILHTKACCIMINCVIA